MINRRGKITNMAQKWESFWFTASASRDLFLCWFSDSKPSGTSLPAPRSPALSVGMWMDQHKLMPTKGHHHIDRWKAKCFISIHKDMFLKNRGMIILHQKGKYSGQKKKNDDKTRGVLHGRPKLLCCAIGWLLFNMWTPTQALKQITVCGDLRSCISSVREILHNY